MQKAEHRKVVCPAIVLTFSPIAFIFGGKVLVVTYSEFQTFGSLKLNHSIIHWLFKFGRFAKEEGD